MTRSTLLRVLLAQPDASVSVLLPDGTPVPAHFHITEVGLVRKDFIDCGGTKRTLEHCNVQIWVADDRAHRVTAGKFAKILQIAAPILGDADPEVEVEYDLGVITQMPLDTIEATPAGILLALASKHTACLAQDRCGLPDSTCSTPGCCSTSQPVSLGVR
jgi:hypothetical protein